jgi:hypothetical protein
MSMAPTNLPKGYPSKYRVQDAKQTAEFHILSTKTGTCYSHVSCCFSHVHIHLR